MGFDVLATDLPDVVSSVLAQNVARNSGSLPPDCGAVQVRILDWTVAPEQWVWDDAAAIACTAATTLGQDVRSSNDTQPSRH